MNRAGETPTEVWKPVVGYEGLYEVSNKGNVVSLKRNMRTILSPSIKSNGYLQLCLYKKGKGKSLYVHRLVAESFLDRVDGKEQVNHLDEDKLNNSVENLEWCTSKENNAHGTRVVRMAKSQGTPVMCVETGEIFYSQGECSRKMRLSQPAINMVLQGTRKHHKGFTFIYLNTLEEGY